VTGSAAVGPGPAVFDDLVGQDAVVAALTRAVSGAGGDLTAAARRGSWASKARPDGSLVAATPSDPTYGDVATTGMTHAWLFTGPPGSGRSVAARAFAAALQCRDGGCGHCGACRTSLGGTHADVDVVNTQRLSIGVDDARALVARAARYPSGGRYQVMIIEDADRLTDQAANALLKALEEPTPRTVWLLCAPALEDVMPTIRSRCRHLALRTPPTAAVADVLVRRDGVDPAMAAFAARAAQGHIGRAKRLATDEAARNRRRAVLRLPLALTDLSEALGAAAELVGAATDEGQETSASLDEAETEELRRALGAGTTGRAMPSGSAAVLKDLEKSQKARATRSRRDAIDRALVDLASFYRDVLAVQLGTDVELVNDELRPDVLSVGRSVTPEATLRCIDAVLAARDAIDLNVAPLLAVEAMTVALRAG
jgi:DNA polymerase III subunit delta'